MRGKTTSGFSRPNAVGKFEQLCWSCGRGDSDNKGCPWVIDFTPVDGWDAVKSKLPTGCGDRTTYKIYDCPMFVRGGKHDNELL